MNFLKGNKFLYSSATLITTTIGIGIFGIPFSFAKAGFLTGFIFLATLSFVVLLRHLMYGEIILRTRSKHQLIGYVEKYLGFSVFGKSKSQATSAWHD